MGDWSGPWRGAVQAIQGWCTQISRHPFEGGGEQWATSTSPRPQRERQGPTSTRLSSIGDVGPTGAFKATESCRGEVGWPPMGTRANGQQLGILCVQFGSVHDHTSSTITISHIAQLEQSMTTTTIRPWLRIMCTFVFQKAFLWCLLSGCQRRISLLL